MDGCRPFHTGDLDQNGSDNFGVGSTCRITRLYLGEPSSERLAQ